MNLQHPQKRSPPLHHSQPSSFSVSSKLSRIRIVSCRSARFSSKVACNSTSDKIADLHAIAAKSLVLLALRELRRFSAVCASARTYWLWWQSSGYLYSERMFVLFVIFIVCLIYWTNFVMTRILWLGPFMSLDALLLYTTNRPIQRTTDRTTKSKSYF